MASGMLMVAMGARLGWLAYKKGRCPMPTIRQRPARHGVRSTAYGLSGFLLDRGTSRLIPAGSEQTNEPGSHRTVRHSYAYSPGSSRRRQT
jgi:hypothetical protein